MDREFQEEMTRREAQAAAEEAEAAEAEDDEGYDEDGAIVFEGIPAEWRDARLPPDVPTLPVR